MNNDGQKKKIIGIVGITIGIILVLPALFLTLVYGAFSGEFTPMLFIILAIIGIPSYLLYRKGKRSR